VFEMLPTAYDLTRMIETFSTTMRKPMNNSG